MSDDKSNLAKGRDSYDINVGDSLVTFFNRNITPYPTEAGGPKFDLIPVEKQKDIMVNVARMHAQQEYNRIMELVVVLQKQAASIKRRLDITDAVHDAKYNFQIYHGQIYWLAYNNIDKCPILTHNGPNDWSSGPPTHYEFICKVKWLGDHTWVEVDAQGNPMF
jgi:hypothetical protein